MFFAMTAMTAQSSLSFMSFLFHYFYISFIFIFSFFYSFIFPFGCIQCGILFIFTNMRVNFQLIHQVYIKLCNDTYIRMHFDNIKSFFISKGSASATIKSVCSYSLFKNEFKQCIIQCEILCIVTDIQCQFFIVSQLIPQIKINRGDRRQQTHFSNFYRRN